MFPLLPALILLILQGPSSIEKMALDGRLPAALEAVTRQMERQDPRVGSLDQADAVVLASLLAFSGDPDLSHALIKLLSIDGTASIDEPMGMRPVVGSLDHQPSKPYERDASLLEVSLESQRSRDGPC